MIYDTAAKNAKLIAGESNGIRKRSDTDYLLHRQGSSLENKKTGLSSGLFCRVGARSCGIEPSRDCSGRGSKGHIKHRTGQDGIKLSRECTGQFGRDSDITGLHGMGFFRAVKKHGIARDGI